MPASVDKLGGRDCRKKMIGAENAWEGVAAEHCSFSLQGAKGNALLIERRGRLMSREGGGMQKERAMRLHHPHRYYDVPAGLLSPGHELATWWRQLQQKIGAQPLFHVLSCTR